MKISTSVTLVPVEQASEPARSTLLAGISALELAPDQEGFVGEPWPMAEKALDDPRRHLFAIIVPGPVLKVVGMGILHVGAATDTSWPDDDSAVLLRGFLIDRRAQGLGYGTEATMAAVELAHSLVAELQLPALGVVLSVDERNVAGQHAYRKAGFMDRGRHLGGRSGPRRILYSPFPQPVTSTFIDVPDRVN
ncbi:hypothetical protein ART_0145 [Arthrobacter sp. PAMC 25486]|uniref:GNAT family N-acetyltransferase n=1 Tax=Arthrobacter sp. PAMC 25486 TaxID=1494608 RepID=UPI000535F3C2|nr:GNAT family N-acetyltransferase [Arthrobacter sp. PAMC 25486]AIX99743.1 hypothetical protein ART_0145 [Arthrobacter sp. PAMC 25486]